MKNISKNKQGYSIIVAIFMIGFLLVLTTGVLNLVLREMKDNKGAENYLKAYAGAEGAMELGLLGIKDNGYGYDEDLLETHPGAEVLSFNSTFRAKTDPQISYSMDIMTKDYTQELGTGTTSVIPLFWKGAGGNQSMDKPQLLISDTLLEGDIVWNIIGSGEGLSGTGGFIYSDIIAYRAASGGFVNTDSVETFLQAHPQSYLMLFNKNTANSITYQLKEEGGGAFSKPVGTITSSVKMGKYRQNISTVIDNTEFLRMLKYSVYSN